MKAFVKYLNQFVIPKDLPHRGPQPDEESEGWADFCDDYVSSEKDGKLVLSSAHGRTEIADWSHWEDAGDHYVVKAEAQATFEGARNALNAVAGIKFPDCEVTRIESTIGQFENLEDYDRARELVLPFMRATQMFLANRHEHRGQVGSWQDRREQADRWLAAAETAVAKVISHENGCANPVHADGSIGWIP